MPSKEDDGDKMLTSNERSILPANVSGSNENRCRRRCWPKKFLSPNTYFDKTKSQQLDAVVDADDDNVEWRDWQAEFSAGSIPPPCKDHLIIQKNT